MTHKQLSDRLAGERYPRGYEELDEYGMPIIPAYLRRGYSEAWQEALPLIERMENYVEHNDGCKKWCWTGGEPFIDHSAKCTCGLDTLLSELKTKLGQ